MPDKKSTSQIKNSRNALQSIENVSSAASSVPERRVTSITDVLETKSHGKSNERVVVSPVGPQRVPESHEIHTVCSPKEDDDETYLGGISREEVSINERKAETNVECKINLNTNHLNPSTSTVDSQWNPQSFYIDFTPTNEDEQYYDKCIEFWEMINASEDMQRLIVSPELEEISDVDKEADVATTTEDDVETIVDLEDDKGFNELKFPAVALVPSINRDKMKIAGVSQEPCCSSNASSYFLRTMVKEDAAKVCQDMEHFDRRNPK